jgi:ascorbate-specific PTS system EIIC-type component UlaA
MMAVLAASGAALATAPAVLVTLVAVILLLALRAWTEINGLVITRHVRLLLDGTIGALTLLFIGLVAVRFITVG